MFSAIPSYETRHGPTRAKLLGIPTTTDTLPNPALPMRPSRSEPSETEPTPGNPLGSLGEYTVASQLADSRAASPEPEENKEDLYDDPVKLGILPEDSVMGLFYSFHTSLNPVLAILDPTLHTPQYVRRRSKVLYTAILSAACKFFRPESYKPVHDMSQLLVGRALADGICTVEYIQALSIVSYWREPDDGSCWRKIGLAIRMAFELNLHLISEEDIPIDELRARERLNRERTWFHLVCYDWNTALQRGKPRMISEDHFPHDARRWIDTHSAFPCNADILIVVSLELAPHYNLYQSIRSATTDQNRTHLEAFIRHIIRECERLSNAWAPENVESTLLPMSRSFVHFYYLRMRLIISELKLLLLHTPMPGASHMVMLDCTNAALAVLRHVIEDFAPNGYLSYGQDFVPFSTTYAGAWLFKQYSRFDEPLRATTREIFRTMGERCRTQIRFPRDTPSYYCMFFEHLLTRLPVENGTVNGLLDSGSGGRNGGLAAGGMHLNMGNTRPSSIPPLEDMDATWLLAADGFNNWRQGTAHAGIMPIQG